MTSEMDNEDEEFEEEGIFTVTQILPVECAENLKADDEEEPSEPRYEESCTYQLGPTVTIKPRDIEEIAERILHEQFKDQEYSEDALAELALKVSADIRESVRALCLDRYRIVCQVTVGEKCNQDVAMTFLCLWKHDFDHYAVATYDGSSIFATALVFVLYKQ